MRSEISTVIRKILDASDFSILEQPVLYQIDSYRLKVRSNSRVYKVLVELHGRDSGFVKIFNKDLIHTFEFRFASEVVVLHVSSRDYNEEMEDYMLKLNKRRGD